MDGKVFFLAIGLAGSLLTNGWAQDSAKQDVQVQLDALKAELKATQERLDKLSQKVADLSGPVGTKVSPEPSPPRAAPVQTPAAAAAEKPAPAESGAFRTHTVAKGETLTQIAKGYNVTVQEIEQLNKIGDAKKLQAGQTIKIPPAPAAAATPGATASPAK